VYEEFANTYRNASVHCVRNERYAETGSMYTLHQAQNEIDSPFLLLESDLLYEPRALVSLLHLRSDDDCVILASGFTNSGDEVYLETGTGGLLRNLSKDRTQLRSVDAELVGVSRVGPATVRAMCGFMEQRDEGPKLSYEDVFAAIAAAQPIRVLKIEDLVWCEIDDAAQLERAQTRIVKALDNLDTHNRLAGGHQGVGAHWGNEIANSTFSDGIVNAA